MANNEAQGLARLDELDDFKVAEGDPDVRGWDVVAADGRKIGEVEHLIADTRAMRVRYLEVELDQDVRAAGEERNALLPIGSVRLDDERDQVLVTSLSSAEFTSFPAFARGGAISRDYETSVTGRFAGGMGAAATAATATDRDDDFYSGEHFDESRARGDARLADAEAEARRLTLAEERLAVGKQRREAGEVEVRKVVETEHVQQSVPLTREEVTIERRPLSADANVAATGTPFTEDEITVPVMEEQAVVEKRVVPKEEVVIKKQAVTEQETVEADVRKERLVVDKDQDIDRTDRR